jgi:hypothetical protein
MIPFIPEARSVSQGLFARLKTHLAYSDFQISLVEKNISVRRLRDLKTNASAKCRQAASR